MRSRPHEDSKVATMEVADRVAAVERLVGYTFENRDLIEVAITHPSAAEGNRTAGSYERLEFLGDSILGAIVAVALFERFPSMDEGNLTRLKISLVSGKVLSEVGHALGLNKLIIFGQSEQGTGARGMASALENVYEAIVGALYLDGGWEAARTFVSRTLTPYMDIKRANQEESPKSRLQEVAQGAYRCAPSYRLKEQSGPAHAPIFTCVAIVADVVLGCGMGPTKKAAESAAAEHALSRLELLGTDPDGPHALQELDLRRDEGR